MATQTTLQKAGAKKSGAGAKQDTTIARMAETHPLEFAGYAVVRAMGTPLTACIQACKDIVGFKNAALLLLSVAATAVPRGIVVIPRRDPFNIRNQGHSTLIIDGSREGLEDEINYRALRMVGFIFAMIGSGNGSKLAKNFLDKNGNPLSLVEIVVPADTDDEALAINGQLQKTFTAEQRQSLATEIGNLTDGFKNYVFNAIESAGVLHDQFLAVIKGTETRVAFADGKGKTFLVDDKDAARQREITQKGVFTEADFADERKWARHATAVTKFGVTQQLDNKTIYRLGDASAGSATTTTPARGAAGSVEEF